MEMHFEENPAKDGLRNFFGSPLVKKILTFLAVFSLVYFSFQISLMAIFNTSEPFFVVTSDSMKHYDDSWKEYFLQRGIDPTNFPMQGGFERGDVLVIRMAPAREISVGDVIVFEASGHHRKITHRVVEIIETDGGIIFRTKGDANPDSLWFERSIPENQVRGKAVFVIPKIGNIWLWLSGR